MKARQAGSGKGRSGKDEREESDLKVLSRALQVRGFRIRREQLARGYGFAVKSGQCVFDGTDVVFLDRRLPLSQQLSLLLDFILSDGSDSHRIELTEAELDELSQSTQKMINRGVSSNRAA